MSFKKYVSDQKWFIITYFLLMFFITLIVIFDPGFKINISNVIYLEVTSFCIITVYFIANYYKKKNFITSLLMGTPKPKTCEQEAYIDLLKSMNDNHQNIIEEMNQEKKDQLEYMTRWFHEIKTPIAVSRLLLETEISSPSLSEEMDKIEHFVEQALYFSRLNDFHKDYLIQEINLEKLIKTIVKANAKGFIGNKITIDLNLNEFFILSDKKALSYIINQLLLNALKYALKNGKINIEIDKVNKNLIIKDHGIGIPSEDLPRVFEKGFTGRNGRNYERSTGMGLYLAQQMAIKLGHNLSISSKEGEYTEVTLYFPTDEEPYLFKQTKASPN